MPYRELIDEPVIEQWLLRFGTAVKAARRHASLSQETLAARSGVNQSSISRLEHGTTPYMSLLRLGRISVGLGGRVPLGPCPHGHECAFGRPLATAEEVRAYVKRRQFIAQGIVDPVQLDMLARSGGHLSGLGSDDGP